MFSAAVFEAGEVRIGADDVGALRVKAADIYDGSKWVLDDLLSRVDFSRRKVTRWIIERDEAGTAASAIKEVFFWSHYSRDGHAIEFVADSLRGAISRQKIPSGKLLRSEFPGILTEGVAR